MSMMHPLPQSRSPRYYQVRTVVRYIFWNAAFFGFLIGMYEIGLLLK